MMTTSHLRDSLSVQIYNDGYDALEPIYKEQIDIIMASVKDHTNYVIGDDKDIETLSGHDYDNAVIENELKARQRNRGGAY